MAQENKFSALDKFSLVTGIIGLVADTLAIGSFVYSLGLFALPKGTQTTAPQGNLLLTAIVGFYSLTLIVWFLFRFERSRSHEEEVNSAHELVEFDSSFEANLTMLGFVLCPVIGSILLAMFRQTRIIFFLAIFIAFLPTTLWIYALSSQAWLALGIGLLGSATLSQYSTFFALILDQFFS
jgi:uncharacterized membrane protein